MSGKEAGAWEWLDKRTEQGSLTMSDIAGRERVYKWDVLSTGLTDHRVGFWGCSLISIESSDSGNGAELSAREAEALQATVTCIGACHIGELFADSKFLQADSLLELCQAIVHAPGPIPCIVATGDNSDTAEVPLSLCFSEGFMAS